MNDSVVLLEEPIKEREIVQTDIGYVPGKMVIPRMKLRLPERILNSCRSGKWKYYGPEIARYNGKKYLLYGICPTNVYYDSVIGTVKNYIEGVYCYIDNFETY